MSKAKPTQFGLTPAETREQTDLLPVDGEGADQLILFEHRHLPAVHQVTSRLVATTDDVPAELVQRQQDFWNERAEFDDVNDVPDAMWGIPEDIHAEMMAEIGRGTYARVTATEFITEFIRRVNEAQRARPWIWPLPATLGSGGTNSPKA